MALSYLPLYFSYKNQLAMLPDDARGRVTLAVLEYAQNGTLTEFDSRSAEAMLFSGMCSQYDRDAERYLSKCAKNRANIDKRWNKQDTNEYGSIRTYTNDTKEKEKEKEKEKKNEKEREKEKAASSADDDTHSQTKQAGSAQLTDCEKAALPKKLHRIAETWLAYKHEQQFSYTQIQRETLLCQIAEEAKTHGADAVKSLMQMTISNGWQGIPWERLQSAGEEKPAENNSGFSEEQLSDLDREWLERVKKHREEKHADSCTGKQSSR